MLDGRENYLEGLRIVKEYCRYLVLLLLKVLTKFFENHN